MTVYLVACTYKTHKSTPGYRVGFLKRWMTFIKGPVDHVELSFVEEGRETYGFNLTLLSKTKRFCARDYSTIDDLFDVVWYELPLVDQVECERYCERNNGRGAFSIMAMMRSAMPFDNEEMAKAFADFVENDAVPREFFDTDASEGGDFCGSSTMKALKAAAPALLADVDPRACTAFDVVVHAVQKLGARATPRPTFKKIVDPEIPRSENWYG